MSAAARETLRAEIRRAAPRAAIAFGTRDPSLAFLDLVEGLAAAQTLEEKLQRVTDGAAALLGVPRVTLRLLDEGRARLLVAARTGASLHGRGGAELTVGEGLGGWVAQHRAPLRVDDADADPRFVEKPGRIDGMRSFLGVPLFDEHGVIGVLATTSPAPQAFSLVDERWLRIIARAAAPALAAARRERLDAANGSSHPGLARSAPV